MGKINVRERLPLLVLGMLALLTAMWAGLIRLGWGLPVPMPALPSSHGALMVSGFLGTVIGVERAVALTMLSEKGEYRWTYLGPLLTGLGTLALLGGLTDLLGPLLMTLGSLCLVLVFGLILRLQMASYTIIMALGALLWLVGNGLWLFGWPLYVAVSWWAAFLILTVAGERMELNRVLFLSGTVQAVFFAAVFLLLVGLVIQLFNYDSGMTVAGLGILAIALWLLRFDVARYTVRKSGLTRFIAICLLAGYTWLAIGGVLAVSFGGVTAGLQYDAIQHTIFVGFVISMIFGHAPIIFPAITGRPLPFSPIFYSHLVLLHLSLILRVAGDLAVWLPGRQLGGLLNVIAILLFIVNTIMAMRRAPSGQTTKTVTPRSVA
jgi:hypothetical protein